MLCTVSVIRSCQMLGMSGVGLLNRVASGSRVWWRRCSDYCNYIISSSDLDNAEVHSPTERHAAMTWAQRLKRVFNIDIEECSPCVDLSESLRVLRTRTSSTESWHILAIRNRPPLHYHC